MSRSNGGWPVIIIAAFIFANWQWIVALALILIGIAASSRLFIVLGDRHLERQRYYAERDAEYRARADYQNSMAYRGDPDGLYGNYHPVTMPVTGPNYPRPDWSTVIQNGGIE